MAVDGLEMDFLHRFILMRRDPHPENEAEKQAIAADPRNSTEQLQRRPCKKSRTPSRNAAIKGSKETTSWSPKRHQKPACALAALFSSSRSFPPLFVPGQARANQPKLIVLLCRAEGVLD